MVRHGNLSNHLSDLDYETVESVARYASDEDRSKLRTLVRRLSSAAQLGPG